MAKVSAKRAQKVLTALIDGVHPETGAELGKESILQNVDVVRCLMMARDAVVAVEARATRRSQLPSAVGTTWTPDEESKLVEAFQAGQSIETIAASHSRTIRAIEARLERLGLITASQRTTSNSFTGEPAPKPPDD